MSSSRRSIDPALDACSFAVFVYGTLRPGGHYYQQLCKGRLAGHIPGWTTGLLFHLPAGYPAASPGHGSIRGDLLFFDDPCLMREIDELEGFDPAKPASNCEYQRVRADIVDQFRQPLGSFDMYLMDRPKVERLGGQPIPEGDWMAWLQQAGFTAF